MKKSDRDKDKIVLRCIENRRGAVLLRDHYIIIADFILDTLTIQTENIIELNELLEVAHDNLDAQFRGDVSWLFLQVKQDLEARGLITTTLTRNREQFISLKDPHVESVPPLKRYPALF